MTTRHAVLVALAAHSDSSGAATTVESLVAALDADRDVVSGHLDALVDCHLATRPDEGRIRVTTTGEQLLALDVDGAVIVDRYCE